MHRLADLLKVLPTFALCGPTVPSMPMRPRRVKDERLRIALSFHPLFIGGDPFHVTSMYALVSHLESAFGVHYAMGGVQAIAEAMVKVIEGQGGASASTPRPTRSWSTKAAPPASGCGRRGAGGAEVIVSNADAGHTYGRLLRDQDRALDRPEAETLALVDGAVRLVLRHQGHARHMARCGHHTISSARVTAANPRYFQHRQARPTT